jgi:hypothetical protein
MIRITDKLNTFYLSLQCTVCACAQFQPSLYIEIRGRGNIVSAYSNFGRKYGTVMTSLEF